MHLLKIGCILSVTNIVSSERRKKYQTKDIEIKPFQLLISMLSYHVRIIPVSRSSIWHDLILVVTVVVDDPLNRLPGILDIIKVPPQITGVNDSTVVWLKLSQALELCKY